MRLVILNRYPDDKGTVAVNPEAVSDIYAEDDRSIVRLTNGASYRLAGTLDETRTALTNTDA